MEHPSESKNTDANRLTLHRITTKNSSFESFNLTLGSLQKPLNPTLEMQVFANIYPQENAVHQAVLSLKIQAKYQTDVLWKIQLEQAGFYMLEGFSEEQQKTILNGFCMNQLYVYAGPVVNQMVVQAGFAPIYLQPMDFHQLYQQQKKKEAESKANSTVNGITEPVDLATAFKCADEGLSLTQKMIN